MSDGKSIDDVIMAMISMGFELEDCKEAIAEGKLSVSAAVEWILAGKPRHSSGGVLRLGPQNRPDATDVGSNPFRNPQPLGSNNMGAGTSSAQEPGHEDTLRSRLTGTKEQQDIKERFAEKQRREAEKIAKEEKLANRKAREEVLKQIQEDRDSTKQRRAAAGASSNTTMTSESSNDSSSHTSSALAAKAAHPATSHGKTTIIQVRLDGGQVVRHEFDAASSLSEVWEFVKSHNVPNIDECFLVQPFPRHEYSDEDMLMSLCNLGLSPTGSLILSRKLKGEPFQKTKKTNISADADALPNQTSSNSTVAADDDEQSASLESHHSVEHMDEQDPDEEEMEEDEFMAEAIPPPVPPGLGLPQQFAPGHGLGGMGRGVGRGVGFGMENILGGMGGHALGRGRGGIHAFEGQGQMLSAHPWNEDHLPHHNQDPKQLAAEAANRRYHEPQPAAPAPPREVTPIHHALPTLTQLLIEHVCHRMTDPQVAPFFSMQGVPHTVAIKVVEYLIHVEKLRPKTLQPFVSCRLNKLDLEGYRYTTNELLASFRPHTCLLHLNLAGCPLISDNGVKTLGYLKRLKVLRISDNKQLTDKSLQVLQGLEGLKVLMVNGTGITDEGVMAFAQSHQDNLEHLDMSQTSVTHQVLPSLQNLPNLHILNLEATKVLSLSGVQNLTSLQALDIGYTDVVTESLLCLQNHPNLQALNLSNTGNIHGDTALQYLQGLKLETLQLPSRSSTTDMGLHYLSNMPLRTLDLTNYNSITDVGMTAVGKIASLKKLRLSNTKISDQGVQALASLSTLEELMLDRVAVTDNGAQLLSGFAQLEELSLAETLITDQLLVDQVLHKCIFLKKLNLSRTSITDLGILQLRLPELTLLNVDSTFLTTNVCLGLQNSDNLPKLERLVFSNLQVREVAAEAE